MIFREGTFLTGPHSWRVRLQGNYEEAFPDGCPRSSETTCWSLLEGQLPQPVPQPAAAGLGHSRQTT